MRRRRRGCWFPLLLGEEVAELGEGDEEGEGGFAGEDEELEGEQGWVEGQFAEHRVEKLGEQGGGVGAGDGVIFEDEQGGEGEVAPEAAPLEVVCQAQEGHHEG